MSEAVTDFLRNAGLLALLNLLIVTIFVLVGLVTSLVSRPGRPMRGRVAWAMVPLLSGLVTMFVGYIGSDRSMFGIPDAETIARNRRYALIHGLIGILGAALFLATGLPDRKRNVGNGGGHGSE